MTSMGDASLYAIGFAADEAEARQELKNIWERLQVEYGKKNEINNTERTYAS